MHESFSFQLVAMERAPIFHFVALSSDDQRSDELLVASSNSRTERPPLFDLRSRPGQCPPRQHRLWCNGAVLSLRTRLCASSQMPRDLSCSMHRMRRSSAPRRPDSAAVHRSPLCARRANVGAAPRHTESNNLLARLLLSETSEALQPHLATQHLQRATHRTSQRAASDRPRGFSL